MRVVASVVAVVVVEAVVADVVVPLLVTCVAVEAWEALHPMAAATAAAAAMEVASVERHPTAAAVVVAAMEAMVVATATLEGPLDLLPGGKRLPLSTQRFSSSQHTYFDTFLLRSLCQREQRAIICTECSSRT